MVEYVKRLFGWVPEEEKPYPGLNSIADDYDRNIKSYIKQSGLTEKELYDKLLSEWNELRGDKFVVPYTPIVIPLYSITSGYGHQIWNIKTEIEGLKSGKLSLSN